MATETRYFLLYNGKPKLARVHVGYARAEVFRDGAWHEANHVSHQVTGIGGDSDFQRISDEEAPRRFPEAFGATK